MKYLLLTVCLLFTFPAYAEKNVVLQFSDDDVKKQFVVLSIANNLVKKYGDEINLEIVAFGPGLTLFTANTKYPEIMKSLSHKGVKLTACQSTHSRLSKAIGKDIPMNDYVGMVGGGASHIIELVSQGYILLKP